MLVLLVVQLLHMDEVSQRKTDHSEREDGLQALSAGGIKELLNSERCDSAKACCTVTTEKSNPKHTRACIYPDRIQNNFLQVEFTNIHISEFSSFVYLLITIYLQASVCHFLKQ